MHVPGGLVHPTPKRHGIVFAGCEWTCGIEEVGAWAGVLCCSDARRIW